MNSRVVGSHLHQQGCEKHRGGLTGGASVQQPPVLATAAATHFSCAFISAMAPDTDFVATAAVLHTVKRPRTYWDLALVGQRHRCPVLLLSAACMLPVYA